MATPTPNFGDDTVFPAARLYTACFFDRDEIVPRVQLLAAAHDDEAIAEMRSSQVFKRRELWDRHRLVAIIPPNPESRT